VAPLRKVGLGERQDRVLLLVLMVLLAILGGLVFNIYEEHRQRLAALREDQLAREAEASRLAKKERIKHEQEKEQRLAVEQLLEKAHQKIIAEDWSEAENYLKQAEALQVNSTKIAAMRMRLQNAKHQKLSLETLVEPAIHMKLVQLKGECFDMGSPETQPERYANETPHRVCLDSYWISQHEVTNAQYRRFKPDHNSGSFRGATLNDDQQPVVEVSWEEAMDYAEWLSQLTGKPYRLPTEAEWEYAARARTETVRFWGNESKTACTYANVADKAAQRYWNAHPIHDCDDNYSVAAPVGVFEANPFALYDMLGNVSEWTCSTYQHEYGKQDNRCASQAALEQARRAVRGGSWDDPPRLVRSTDRNGKEPATRDNDLGFRLVLDPKSRWQNNSFNRSKNLGGF
jgi:formylglycine-generating enzyme required for sulfatase activity